MGTVWALILIPPVETEAAIYEQVRRLLAPYARELEGEQYRHRQYLQRRQVVSYLNHHRVATLKELADKLNSSERQDTSSSANTYHVDSAGLFWESDANPQGEWDYWVTDGTGDQGTLCREHGHVATCGTLGHAARPASFWLAGAAASGWLSEVLVSPDGTWHGRGRWSARHLPDEAYVHLPEDTWRAEVQALLEQNRACLAVLVSYHS